MATESTVSTTTDCRICKSGKRAGLLVSPCQCKGSMGHVHRLCLEHWLNCSSRRSCEVCSQEFTVTLSRRYTCVRSLRVWFSQRAKDEPIRFFFLTFMAAVFLLLCVTLINIVKNDFPEVTLPEFTLFMVTAVAYVMFMCYLTGELLRAWYSWWITCYVVKLVIEGDATTVSTV